MKRRGNGEGCIRKLKDGSWEARKMIGTNVNGKPKFKTFTRKTRKEVQDLLNEYIMKERNKQPDIACNQTMSKWLLNWFESYVNNNVKNSTKVSYEGIINNHLMPRIGHIKLNQLNKVEIEEMYSYLLEKGRADGKGGLDIKTVKNISLVLHKALDEAMKNEYIIKNPADMARVPKRKEDNKEKKEIEVFTRGEQKALLEACGDDVYGVAVKVALSTGVRLGELLGMQWKDIDYENNTITISRQVNRTKDYSLKAKAKTRLGIQNDTKSKASNRKIYLPSEVMNLLDKRKEQQDIEKSRWGKAYNDFDMIFAREDGYYIDPSTFRDNYRKILKRAEVKHHTIHALRHTFATRAIEENHPIKVVSKILGHASIVITLDTYSHVLPELQSDIMKNIVSSIGIEE